MMIIESDAFLLVSIHLYQISIHMSTYRTYISLYIDFFFKVNEKVYQFTKTFFWQYNYSLVA